MTDYTKIVREVKALQDARSLEDSELRRSEEPLRVFFRGVGIMLGEEAGEANRDLFNLGLLTGEAVRGIVYHGQLADDVFHLTYGNSRGCDVRLDVLRSDIKASLAGEVHSSANGATHTLVFLLENDVGSVTSRAANSNRRVPGTLGMREIAKSVVEGMVLGNFQHLSA